VLLRRKSDRSLAVWLNLRELVIAQLGPVGTPDRLQLLSCVF